MKLAESLAGDGIAVVHDVFDERQLSEWRTAIESVDWMAHRDSSVRMHGARNLLALPAVQRLTSSCQIADLVESALGCPGIPARGILFNKVPDANWSVTWHQDRMVAVRQRRDLPGYGPWSQKEGVWHVQPPVEVLERMVTLRLHLDDCFAENGPLQAIPGSHNGGILSPEEIDRRVDSAEKMTCTVARGSVIVMRPLILHSSSKAIQPTSRRVVHLEFASGIMQHGLEWCSYAMQYN